MSASDASRGKSEPAIRKKILQAIFEQRLPPGEHLVESSLAETFQVSRTVIRQVIARLEQDGIVVARSYRGAFVASPTQEEVSQILAVRKMIEPEIVRILVNNAGQLPFSRLEEHLDAEDTARRLGERGTLVRLTGEFHLHLADMTGNKVLIRLMTELQALTCLAILLYASGNDACPIDEHRKIYQAIKKRKADEAIRLMLHHLQHVESDLDLSGSPRTGAYSRALEWMKNASNAEEKT
jgi:DNA-binding GntR family transcriptional regulator